MFTTILCFGIFFIAQLASAAHPLCQLALLTNPSEVNRTLNKRFRGWKCPNDPNAITEKEICETWSNLECSSGKLTGLFLRDLGLKGTIPSALGTLSRLKALALDENKFSGTIPSEIGLLSRLNTLTLSINNITGTVPAELGKLKRLRTFYLSHNQLTGTLPVSLASLRSLEFMSLAFNSLTGTIPEAYSAFVDHSVELNNNNLDGTIPQSLCGSYMLFTFNNEQLVNSCDDYCSAEGDCDTSGIVHSQFKGKHMLVTVVVGLDIKPSIEYSCLIMFCDELN